MITNVDQLKIIEKEENIKIIYAFLGGSRAFNIHTDDSDYDVYFVFDGKVMTIKRDVDNVSYKGYSRTMYTDWVLGGANFYFIDGLRCSEVYINTEDYHTNLLSLIDEEKIYHKVRERLSIQVKNHKDKRHKDYLQYRLKWMNENKSIYYPLIVQNKIKKV